MELESWIRIARLAAAGICMGLGAIGSATGIGYAACKGAQAVTRQPHASGVIMRTMLIGMAVGESPAIFSLVVAVVLLFTKTEDLVFLHIPALLGAGLCMGLGAVGCGMGEGFVAGEACDGVSKAPENAGLITRTMLIGQAVSESTAIYSLVVAILLIYVAV
jgi:F-type H+-transporting ATPase subunit c